MKLNRINFQTNLLVFLAAIALAGVLVVETGVAPYKGAGSHRGAGEKVLSADGPIVPPQLPTPPKSVA